jgi:hypothetical protein
MLYDFLCIVSYLIDIVNAMSNWKSIKMRRKQLANVCKHLIDDYLCYGEEMNHSTITIFCLSPLVPFSTHGIFYFNLISWLINIKTMVALCYVLCVCWWWASLKFFSTWPSSISKEWEVSGREIKFFYSPLNSTQFNSYTQQHRRSWSPNLEK